MVQAVKAPLGSKGARITMQVAIPSRMLVYMPVEKSLGISQKIASSSERNRLREMIQSIPEFKDSDGGFIVRTVAEGVDIHEMRADMLYLQHLWCGIQVQLKLAVRPVVIYEELPLYLRIIRDIPIERIKEIQVNSAKTLDKMLTFMDMYAVGLSEHLGLYQGERPFFDVYNIEEEIQNALDKRVDLKSGGFLMIDQTEAMTTIDINTGAFVGHKNLEETIFRTNLEATRVIARQLRLRNLGGIIILDFIDMEMREYQHQVLNSLQKALSKDLVKTSISSISNLGLVEMTRKCTRDSLERILCESCSTCRGRGTVKTIETVIYLRFLGKLLVWRVLLTLVSIE